MELHVQKCQQCGSRNLRNILVREESQKVYVQCRDCESLVARYILAPGGYYHEGKEFESFLRSLERDSGSTSGKDVQQLFDDTRTHARQEYADVVVKLKERYSNTLP